MDRRIPDTATFETAVALALRAPSARNSQPWAWRIGYRSLHLFSDPDRWSPGAGPDERDLLLSCGTAVHHVRVSFAALGWRTEVRRLPDASDPTHLAVVTPHPGEPGEEAVALAAAIPRRRSDRRSLGAWPVPRHHLAAMTRAALAEEAALQVVTGSSRRLLLASIAAGTNTPAGDQDRPGTLLTRRLIPGTDTGGALLVLTTATDDPLARLRAGEATSAVLLTATVLGLSSCPLTDPLKNFAGRRSTSPGHAQIVLRIGWPPPNAAPLPPTPRRRLGHVLEPLQAPPKYHHRLPAP